MMSFMFLLAAAFLFAQPSQDVWPGDPFPTHFENPGFKKVMWVTSENFNHRPAGAVIDTIVIHSTVIPTLGDTAHAFYRKSSEVSANYIIGKDGSIVQCVPDYFRAWHAGVSTFLGRNNVNDFSIGFELVNLNNGHDPYPEKQLAALRAMVRVLKQFYPIKYLTSHEFIALPHGRKTDPAGFPWKQMEGLGLQIHVTGLDYIPPSTKVTNYN